MVSFFHPIAHEQADLCGFKASLVYTGDPTSKSGRGKAIITVMGDDCNVKVFRSLASINSPRKLHVLY